MFKKISAIVAVVLISLMIILLVALKVAPAIGIYFASKWYAQQGENYRLEVKDWQFSPFDTQLALSQVVLHHPHKGAGKTSLNKVFVRLNLWDLLENKVSLQTVELEGLRLDLLLEQMPKYQDIQIAGLDIPLNKDNQQSEPESENTDSTAQPWQVSLHTLVLNDLQVGWQVRTSELATQGQATLERFSVEGFSTEAGNQPHVRLALSLNEFQLEQPELRLQKPLSLTANGTLSQLLKNPTWQGDIQLSNFLLKQGTTVAGFDLLALEHVQANIQQQSFKDLRLNAVQVLVKDMQLTLQELLAEQLHFTAEDKLELQLNGLALQTLALSNQEKELLTLADYQLKNLTVNHLDNELALNLGEHSFSGLVVNIERDKQGRLVGVSAANSVPKESAEETSEKSEEPREPTTAAKVFAIVLVNFLQNQNSENKGMVHISDASVSPKLNTQLVLKQFKIGETNSRIEQKNIALTHAVPVFVELGLGKFSTTEIDAQLGLYQADKLYPEGRIKLKTRQLDMVDFNGYLIQVLGYQLDRGSLDIDADIIIHNTELKGEVKLLLRNSKFTPADEETIKKVSKQISMPIDMALDLLRDKNGNVVLSIPLSGHLNDPDFGLRDVMRQLTNKALKATAIYFIKQSIQPYGTLLDVATYAGDYLFAIRLDALSYAQQQAELTEEQQAHLTKIAQLMQNKKSIEVQGCPFVDKAEAESLGDGWPELAKARGTAVKQWFEANHPEQSARFTLCRPQQGEKAEVVLGVN